MMDGCAWEGEELVLVLGDRGLCSLKSLAGIIVCNGDGVIWRLAPGMKSLVGPEEIRGMRPLNW